jgi:hypothetical protein
MKTVNSVMTSPLSYTIDLIDNCDHSKEYKAKITSYAQNLASKGLPIIFDAYHLAYLIGIPPHRIVNIIKDRDYLYNTYKIRKKSGGYRWIMSPTEELKGVQNWIKTNILDEVSIHDSANGFIKGRSIISNAEKHIGKELILNLDLYRYFDTITENRVYGILKKLGYTEKLSFDMARLLCRQPTNSYWRDVKKENRFKKKFIKSKPAIIPQGAPTSPVISNIIANKLDESFSKYALICNLEYTRYADDITFSGNRKDMLSLSVIKNIIRQQGFTINIKKTKYVDHYKKQTVTGLTVNNGVFVNKEIINLIKQELYYCLKYGYKNHLEFKRNKGFPIKTGYKDWLLGIISFIYSVEKGKGEKFYSMFNQIDWEI